MISLITKLTIFFAILFFFIIKNIYYFDPVYGCNIFLTPGLELNNNKVLQGLQILKKTSIEDYKDVCARVDKIDPNVGCGGFEGGCFYHTEPRTIYITTANTGLEWVAGVIVHETCHAKQFYEGRLSSEQECHEEDDRIIKKIVTY